MLSEKRSQEAAKKFFKQTLGNNHCSPPRVAGVDKNAAHPPAFDKLKEKGVIPKKAKL